MSSTDPFDPDFWIRVGLAVACASAVGVERQLRGKPAGIRTSIFVCLGTAIFVALGHDIAGDNTDPTRVLGQVITGIGFLGAGVILTRGGLVHGVTTAAVIWMLAAIGASIGLQRYAAAVALTGVSLFVLVGVRLLERGIRALNRGREADDPDSRNQQD